MDVLVLNGSPKTEGTVASLLRRVARGAGGEDSVTWVNVYDLSMKHCTGCMACRESGACVLPRDDAHAVGEKIARVDALIIGTPVHWGNMSAPLKQLFDRNVPIFMADVPQGMPRPKHKGKPAVVVSACTTPWPFNFILPESRGALRAVKQVLKYGGYKIVGTVVKPGSKTSPEIPPKLARRAEELGAGLISR